MGFEHAGESNLGSTWYSGVDQFRLVSYLTLVSMVYLSNEEFSEPEKNGQIGTWLWPYWHYGVLLLYGQNLALNHLIALNESFQVISLSEMMDYPSGNDHTINDKLHVHVYHGEDMFSKFAFKNGFYDKLSEPSDELLLTQIKYYCLKMALNAKRTNGSLLNDILINQIQLNKI